MECLGHRMVAATGPAEYQNDGQGDAEKTGRDPAASEDMVCHRVAAANQELEGTTAGTSILASNPPAEADCTVVKRIHRSGAIIIGRSNLTEFAYSGLGINRTRGTPRSPWDRETGRIPGGSSCGAAVSVTDGMAAVAVGSDTGGSVRIPSALCGITGFKSTFGRIPLDHVHPLSYSLDSAGPLGNTVSCCAMLDAIMACE